MTRFQDTPAFWRYFGARLKPFTRPLFLGSVGFLSLSGIAIYQYWNHPDWLQNQIEQPLEAVFGSRNSQEIPELAEEDLAVVADIDNIDLLLQEMEQNRLKTSFQSPGKKNNNNSPDNAFTRFQKTQQAKFKNPTTSNSDYLGIKNNALNNLLKPPALTNYPSNLSTKTSNTSNPVGKLYLSNKKSSLNRTVNSPYLQQSTLSNLGDRSGNFNIRQQGINRSEQSTIVENLNNPTNSNITRDSNSNLNQQTTINNFSNSSVSGRSLNQSPNNSRVNTQNRENNFNRYVAPTPSYNRSVPSNYQLQPQSFGQQNIRSYSQINNSGVNNSQTNTVNRYTAPTTNYNRFVPNNYQSQSRSFEQQNTRNFRNSYRNSLDNSIRTNNILLNPIQNQQSNNQSSNNRNLQPAGQLSSSPLR